MKKHLIAAAVAGAFAVPAMAQVTVSGVVDVSGVYGNKVTDVSASDVTTTTKSINTGSLNPWTTSQIVISGTEDLGGGLRASFFLASGIAGAAVGEGGELGASAEGRRQGFMDRDRNLSLAGGFGTVRLGRFIPAAAMGYHGFSGAATASQGSLYPLAHPVSAAANRVVVGSAGAGSFERQEMQLQFTSPTISGFTLNVNYGTNSRDLSAELDKGEITQLGVHLGYSAGPLSFGIATNNRTVMTENTMYPLATSTSSNAVTNTQTTASTRVDRKGDLDWVGASYDFGAARLSATHVQRKDTAGAGGAARSTATDAKATGLGISVPLGAITLAGSVYQGTDKRAATGATDDMKLTGNQVSVRYALSKRTTVYGFVGTNEVKRDGSANTATATRKESGNAIGILHTF